MAKHKYTLPPIVLYESHADRATSDFLIEQLPRLKKAGYTTICIDGIEPGVSLTQSIAMTRRALNIQINKVDQMHPSHPKHTREVEQLRSIAAKFDLLQTMKEQGFKIGGIDLPISEQLKEASLNSIRREETLTNNTLKEVDENDGSVVVVLGFGHCIFQQMIAANDKNAEQYLWLHIYDPDKATLAYKELVRSYEKKGYASYFPLGVNIFRVSDQGLHTKFWESLSTNCYNYESSNLDISTSEILKSLIGPEVSAHFRKDGQHHIDAVIPLETIEKSSNITPAKFLQGLSKTLSGVNYEIVKINAKAQVIIRNINDSEIAEQISKLDKKG
ncbi:Uncharacterised protein [Legionella beliardensis]|uniref:Uncharacterized protein n=1 Tax=Legionella beliardensis TaxID=91822 RepID=A0A378JY02_9GAMM|nr:hypothetical protein [Legionella beliardensis]STX55631.1 Uncharacterised protein [Legionella beliardensis]